MNGVVYWVSVVVAIVFAASAATSFSWDTVCKASSMSIRDDGEVESSTDEDLYHSEVEWMKCSYRESYLSQRWSCGLTTHPARCRPAQEDLSLVEACPFEGCFRNPWQGTPCTRHNDLVEHLIVPPGVF